MSDFEAGSQQQLLASGNDRSDIVELGSQELLSTKFESLDYDVCESHLYLKEERKKDSSNIIRKDAVRWIIVILIGISTALVASFVNLSIEIVANWKYSVMKYFVDRAFVDQLFLVPYLAWMGLNGSLVLFAVLITIYIEPLAAGPGIGNVICYLNGVKVPRVVRIKTLVVKMFGVIASVSSGLPVGQEGPLIHMGAVIAAGISQGKSTTFKTDFGIFQMFREDHEKRDFVSAGSAAGISAAFGAPVGGILFSLEEGASFWNQALTWKILLCSMLSFFSLNLILSTYHGVPGELAYPGLLNLGSFTNLSYTLSEFPIFICMGVLGGLFGALFVMINKHLNEFRLKYIYKGWHKVLEALMVICVTTTVGMMMMLHIHDCRPLGEDPNDNPVQMFCDDGEYNTAAAIWFQTPESAVRSLFHDPEGSQKIILLSIFSVIYFLLACWTHGISVPSGLFIPSLLIGAAWGRIFGIGIRKIFPHAEGSSAGKYALIGAAAQLAGVTRTTLSLTVLLIEATGNITFGLPIMMTLIFAKWVADLICDGIYEVGIKLSEIPLLPFDPPALCGNIQASEVMSCPVMTLKPVESVLNIVQILRSDRHHGFPVVDDSGRYDEDFLSSLSSHGKCEGLILRYQLIVLLQKKLFVENSPDWLPRVSTSVFRDAYPRFKDIHEIDVSDEELSCHVDLRLFMNPNPYTVYHTTSLPRMFRLFRGLGLRHLIIIDRSNRVVGIVTRKDLARYRVSKKRGRLVMEEVPFV